MARPSHVPLNNGDNIADTGRSYGGRHGSGRYTSIESIALAGMGGRSHRRLLGNSTQGNFTDIPDDDTPAEDDQIDYVAECTHYFALQATQLMDLGAYEKSVTGLQEVRCYFV